MKIKKSYRMLSCIMALLLLVSSSGWSMDMHFCQGNIKRVNLLGKAKSCSDILIASQKCSNHTKALNFEQNCVQQTAEEDTNCCNNIKVEFDHELEFGSLLFSEFEDKRFDQSALIRFNHFESISQLRIIDSTNYIPPILPNEIILMGLAFLL